MECNCARFAKFKALNVWRCKIHGLVDRWLWNNVISIELIEEDING